MMNSEDQRTANRIRCRCYATLCATSEKWPAHLLNLSETGALAAVLNENSIRISDCVELNIDVEDGANLTVRGEVAHIKEHYIGIELEVLNDAEKTSIQDFLNHNKAHS